MFFGLFLLLAEYEYGDKETHLQYCVVVRQAKVLGAALPWRDTPHNLSAVCNRIAGICCSLWFLNS